MQSYKWIELDRDEVQQGTPVRIQAIPFYPGHWWRWEIRYGNHVIMLSECEAQHLARVLMERDDG